MKDIHNFIFITLFCESYKTHLNVDSLWASGWRYSQAPSLGILQEYVYFPL